MRLITLLALLVVGWVPPWAHGQRFSQASLPPEGVRWIGIARNYDPRMLGGPYVFDAQNVWFDEDLGVVKRRGSQEFGALGNSLPIRTLGQWFDTSDTEYLFMVSGTTIAYTEDGSTFVTIRSSWGAAETSMVPAHDKIWFASSSDGLAYWDGSDFFLSTNAATGRYVTRWRNRLWLSGIAGSRSRLDGSHHLDGNTWTVGSYADSPTQIIVGANDGYPINCLFPGHYLLIGKQNNLWALGGTDKRDFTLIQVSPEIGCRSHRSVASMGQKTFWLSQRGVEMMRNFTIPEKPISLPVQDIVDQIIAGSAQTKFWTQTTQSDWQAGNLIASGDLAPVDATTSVGAIRASSITFVDTSSANFAAGTLASVSTNVAGQVTGFQEGGGIFINAGAEVDLPTNWDFNCHNGGSGCVSHGLTATYGGLGTNMFFTDNIAQPAGADVQVTVLNQDDAVIYTHPSGLATENAGWQSLVVDLIGSTATMVRWRIRMAMGSSHTVITSNYFLRPSTATLWWADANSALGTAQFAWDMDETVVLNSTASITSQCFDTGFSTPTWGTFNATVSSDANVGITFETQVSSSCTGVFDSTVSASIGGHITSGQKRVIQYIANFTHDVATRAPAAMFDADLNATTTAYFISQCKQIGDEITAWDVFNITTELVGSGVITAEISTGTACDPVTRSSATWTSITPGLAPSVDTATYAGIRLLLLPTEATDTVKAHDFELTWTEGDSAQLPLGCVDLDGRYWLFYTTSTAADARLDSAVVYQQNGEWTRHEGVRGLSCAKFNNRWYTGSALDDGKIFQQDTGFVDDNKAIEAYVETADLGLTCPGDTPGWMCWKSFSRLHLDLYNPDTSAEFTTKFMVNGNDTWYDLDTIDLDEDSRYVHGELRWNQSQLQRGKYIRFRFGNNQAGEDFKYHRSILLYEVEPPNL